MKIFNKLLAMCFIAALVAAPVSVNAQSDNAPAKAEKGKGQQQKADKAQKADKNNKGQTKIDINTATVDQLTTLPGVDAATANKIIAGRPYSNKSQLKSNGIVSQETFTAITDSIIAHQSKDAADSKKADKAKEKSDKKNKSDDKGDNKAGAEKGKSADKGKNK